MTAAPRTLLTTGIENPRACAAPLWLVMVTKL